MGRAEPTSPKEILQYKRCYLQGLELAKKLPEMGEDEQFELLASDGMIVKRPILLVEDKILVGFKESEWEELFT